MFLAILASPGFAERERRFFPLPLLHLRDLVRLAQIGGEREDARLLRPALLEQGADVLPLRSDREDQLVVEVGHGVIAGGEGIGQGAGCRGHVPAEPFRRLLRGAAERIQQFEVDAFLQ